LQSNDGSFLQSVKIAVCFFSVFPSSNVSQC
jgi:hypothetical protein